MLRKIVYPKIELILNRTAGFLHSKNITPNQLTLGGMALNFVCGWVFFAGLLPLGALLILLAGLGDMLDGPVARVSGRASAFGAFLDSVVDRYSDFFVFGGLAAYFAVTAQIGAFFLVLGTLAGAFVTSYAKARAENFIATCSTGLLERPERLILLSIGTFFTGLLGIVLWILFLGTNFTAIQRVLFTQKQLRQDAQNKSL